MNPDNAEKMTSALQAFGFGGTGASARLFLEERKIVRMGVPPMRIEILTTISGVTFADCYAHRVVDTVDGVEVSVIGLDDLKANKQASGRPKDINDLSNLP